MKTSTRKFLYTGLVTIVMPFGFYLFFTLDMFREFLELMSVGFLFIMPFSMGILTMALAPDEWVQRARQRWLLPWLPVFSFALITLVLEIESFACWIMMLPLFMVFASIGGIFGQYLKSLFRKDNNVHVSFAIIFPFLVASCENMIRPAPTLYTVNTRIDIEAPADTIWNNVLHVREISEAEDNSTLTNFMGFPRPVKGEFDKGAVGGSRKAFFTDGLTFDEVISEYIHRRKMSFTVRVASLPAGMDEHVRIGGKYFDMVDATYELEPLGNNKYRLHLYSHFEMNTTFNFYARWWGDQILSDIQNNILQVIKTRCEKPGNFFPL
jgi:hypothetical protein